MAALAIVITLVAAIMHATWNFILKDSDDRMATVVAMSLLGVVIYGPWILAVQAFPRGVVWHLVASTVIHVLYFAALVGAYNRSDFSVAYPVARGVAPALVAIGAWLFLGDRIGPAEAAALVLIVAAIIWLSWTPSTATVVRGSGIKWAVLTGAAIAAYTVNDAAAVRASGNALSYVVILAATSGVILAGSVVSRGGIRRLVRPLAETPFAISLAAVLNIGAYAIVLFAATRAPVGLVSAVRETSVVFGALAGVAFLDEPFGRRRIVGAAGVAVGIIALGTA